MSSVYPYSEIKSFKAFVQTVLPTVYDDSLSYYELLNKVVEHLNTMGNTINYMQAWLNANGVETYDIVVNSTYGSISGIIDEVKTAVNANKIVRFIVNPSGLYKYVCYYSGSAIETNDETETTKTMFYFAGFKIESSTRYTFRVFKLDTSNGNYTEYDYKLINESDLTSVVNNIFTYIDNTVNSAIPVHGEYNATSGVLSGADYEDFDSAINAGKVCSITLKRSNNADVTCYYTSKVMEQNEQFETFIFSGDTLNTNGSVKGVISVKVKPESVSFIETNIETDLTAINLTFDVIKQDNTYTLNTVNRTPTEVISALSSNSNLDAKIRVYSAAGDYLFTEYHNINYYGLTTTNIVTIGLNCSFTDDIQKNITHNFNFYQDDDDANVWKMQHSTNTEYYSVNFAIMPTSVQDDTPMVQTASATPSEVSGYLSQVIHKPIRCYFSVGGDTNTVYYQANGYSCNAYKYKENSSANEKVVVSFTDYPMYIEGDTVNNTWSVYKKNTVDEIDDLKSAFEDSIDDATWELPGYVDTKGDYTWVIGDCNNYGGYTSSATRILLNEGNSTSHAETDIYVKSSNPNVTFYVNERNTASGLMTGSGWVSEYTVERGKYFRITVRSTPEATITDAETSTEYQAISMNVLGMHKVFPKGYYPIKVVAKDGSAEFSTIQSAIDAAKDGDIIYIKSGLYKEAVVNTKQIALIGQDKYSTVLYNTTGEYATPPLWTCSGRLENITVYAWNENGVSLDSISNLGYALHLDQKWDSVHSRRHIEIKNCVFKSDFGDCIGCGIDEDGYIEISDTICEATHKSGMKVHPFPVAGGTSKMLLKNNVFKNGVDNNAYGLMFHTGGTDNVNFNTVQVEAYNNIAKTYDGWNANCFIMNDYNYGNTLAGMNRFSLT